MVTPGVMLQCPCSHLLHTPISCSSRRQQPGNRYPHNKKLFKSKGSSGQKLQIVIDRENLVHRASSSLKNLFHSSQSTLHNFALSSKEAFEDFQTLVVIDHNHRILISCRRSTLEFLGHLVLCVFLTVIAFRVLDNLRLRFLSRFGFGSGILVRRDRSLAGREVVVAKRKMGFHALSNPLSLPQGTLHKKSERVPKRMGEEERLPRWWPDQLLHPVAVDKQEHQTVARRLIQAIMDCRLSGKDILGDDIIQLRRICRASGARVSFDTVNMRKSFYRVAVDFVLNVCTRETIRSASVQIDGEDPIQFLVGLAYNIGVESIDAAIIISAAVAARTRSSFLQAWALKLQDKYSEAVAEVSKICILHKVFPPEDSSPEMEMVALGLKKQLKLDQRELLWDMLVVACGKCHWSVAEALGLIFDGSQLLVERIEPLLSQSPPSLPLGPPLIDLIAHL